MCEIVSRAVNTGFPLRLKISVSQELVSLTGFVSAERNPAVTRCGGIDIFALTLLIWM